MVATQIFFLHLVFSPDINPKTPPYYFFFFSSIAWSMNGLWRALPPMLHYSYGWPVCYCLRGSICIHITLKPHHSPPQLGLKHLHSHGTPTQVLSLILSDGTSSQHCVSMCDGHVQHSIVHVVVPVMMGHCKCPWTCKEGLSSRVTTSIPVGVQGT